jgi:hypothetical protein
LIVSIAIAACVLPGALILAQGEDTRYFEETGHNVASEFLQFYELHGGRAIFGYPLTRRFQENGRWVQYFQRVRMESHPQNPDPYQVQLGLLGDELGYRQSPIPDSEIPPPTHPDKKYFPETGHTVSFAFLEFYNNNGGLDVFGYPITEWVIEPNGRIVQYFQRGKKMEWYPEHPPGQRVQLGMLGTIYVEQFVDPIHRQREDPRIGPRSPTQPAEPTEELPAVAFRVTDLRVVVTLKHPIVGLRGTQTAYVYVFDQANHGVPGATIDMSVHYKGGRVDQFSLGPTNANGYAQIDFPVGEATPGYVVIVNLQANYRDVQSEVSTAFLPWW